MCCICTKTYDDIMIIYDCSIIRYIPYIKNLKVLHISNCQNLLFISNNPDLEKLKIENCNKLYCIPRSNKIANLIIKDCNKYFDYNNEGIIKFYLSNKIKRWYFRLKNYNLLRNRIMNLILWIEEKRMHPKSLYLQKIINSFE